MNRWLPSAVALLAAALATGVLGSIAQTQVHLAAFAAVGVSTPPPWR